ncbi:MULTISPECIES: hypothetical protein [Microbacterium]|uniref:hypothetical protein n=1 Tax=Microbacterium TaxID=33882 RepID=UPI00249F75D3|nr:MULTISPECIES: hypothetical protein [Microbacterium]WHE36240.1 hypothetical protein P6897_00515 [Microbacterium sp. BDGP8]WRK17490.1 hypothetical protein VC184_00320 [Microbacterium plantarum]
MNHRELQIERKRLLNAYLDVLNDPSRFLDLVLRLPTGDHLSEAIEHEYRFDTAIAQAVSSLGIQYFTPEKVQRVRDELAQLNRALGEAEDRPSSRF